MDDAAVPFPRLGAAVRADLAAVGLNPRRAALRARKEPSQLYTLVGGKYNAGRKFLTDVARAARLPDTQVDQWLAAKAADKADAGVPAVARPAPLAHFPDDRRGDAGRSAGGEAPDVAARRAGRAGDRDLAARVLARVMVQLRPVVEAVITDELAGDGTGQYAEGRGRMEVDGRHITR